MIRLILTVILCVLTAAASVWLTLNPGTVAIDFLGQHYEGPFALGVGLLLVATFILVLIWRGVALAWTAPDAWRRFRTRRRREQGFDALERALIAAAAGEGELAVRQAARADALLERPALSRLLAARAAEAAGDLASAQTHYEALLEAPKTRLVAQRGLAQLALEQNDAASTVRHAGDAFANSPQARWAFEALFNAQVAEARWSDAVDTLVEGERRKHIAPDRAKRRRAVLLTAQAHACAQSDPDQAMDLAERACSASAGFAPAADLAGTLLSERRRHKRACDVIEAAWTIAPHPALARTYGSLRKSDTKPKRAERLRALADLRPEHRESHLLRAEIALDNANPEGAREALGPILAQERPTARLYALGARLAHLEGREDEARRFMARAAHAPGEADWSDIDGEGQAFRYGAEDWKRMVYTYGDDDRLIHPRYERFEIAAEAAPETLLLDAPKATRAQTDIKTQAVYFEPGKAPDDPGIIEGE